VTSACGGERISSCCSLERKRDESRLTLRRRQAARFTCTGVSCDRRPPGWPFPSPTRAYLPPLCQPFRHLCPRTTISRHCLPGNICKIWAISEYLHRHLLPSNTFHRNFASHRTLNRHTSGEQKGLFQGNHIWTTLTHFKFAYAYHLYLKTGYLSHHPSFTWLTGHAYYVNNGRVFIGYLHTFFHSTLSVRFARWVLSPFHPNHHRSPRIKPGRHIRWSTCGRILSVPTTSS